MVYKSLILAIAAIALPTGIAIAEPQFVTAAVPTAANDLIAKLAQTCDGRFVLSDRAIVACQTEQFPRLSTDGQSFRNQGVGAEFNTLMRQLTNNNVN